jgi:hypothetical protein
MQIAINDQLLQQTMQVFHTNNAQLALEKALQFALQHFKNQAVTETNPLKNSLIFEDDSLSPIDEKWNAQA